MKPFTKILDLAARMIAAAILVQTLYFKFGGHPDSVYIFSQLGVEPWGRIGLGVFELLAAILLIIPRTAWLGGIIGIGLMAGAMMTHLALIGIVVHDDGGALFLLACAVMLCSAIVVWLRKDFILAQIQRFLPMAHGNSQA